MRSPRWMRTLARRLHLPFARVPAGPRRAPAAGGRPGRRDDDDDGGAGVREPRVPVGPLPRSDSAAAPIPAPAVHVTLPMPPDPGTATEVSRPLR